MDHKIDDSLHVDGSYMNSPLNTAKDDAENPDGLNGGIVSNGATNNVSQNKGKRKANKKAIDKHTRQLSQAQR